MDFSSWLEFGGQVQETKRASGGATDRVFTAPDGALSRALVGERRGCPQERN